GQDLLLGQACLLCSLKGCGNGLMRREHGALRPLPSGSRLVLEQSCQVTCASPTFYAQQPCVRPIFCQWLLSGQSLSLCNLCFMMRKDQLGSSAVEIIGWTKMRQCYRGVFDVPAWSSLAPWTVPGNLSRLLALPENKVARVLFFGIWIHSVNC